MQFNRWSSTLRWPSNTNDPNAYSVNFYVDQAIGNNRQSLSDGVYALFSSSNSYQAFTNTGVGGPGSAGSLEDIHNNVHGMIGGNGGHMSYLDYAAFDPVFWLHHW
jgi:tyrosinase